MLILTLRTDKPEAEIGLYNDQAQLAYSTWQAHRQLAETIHKQIRSMLEEQNKRLSDLEAIAIYQGPGSFTGLRIGLSVANALADSLQMPILGGTGQDWLQQTIQKLQKGEGQAAVMPEYGSLPHTTTPKH